MPHAPSLPHRSSQPAPGPTTAPPTDVVVEARDLTKVYGSGEARVAALDGVSLTVSRGQFVAVMGPSGSGKSTLLHVMAGVLVPDAGSVSYHGGKSPGGGATDVAEDIAVNIAALDEAARSRLRLNEFGFIFQFGQLLPDLSALDNVTIPLLLAGTPRRRALAQAREARMHILGKMQEAIPAARTELSDFAPRMYQMKINPERIRDVIGKGGATIRAITEETGTTIDIQDDGSITIAAVDAEAARRAQQRIADLTAEVEIGKIYNGTVLKILEFGAIVQVLPGRDGLLHVSQIAQERVNKVEDYVKEGQSVRVKVIEADDKGRLRLSMKAVAAEEANQSGEGA